MVLHLRSFLGLLVVLALQALTSVAVRAEPVLDLRAQNLGDFQLDIRTVWQAGLVPAGARPALQPHDAESLWLLADSNFKPGVTKPVMVAAQQRWVGRLSVLVAASLHSLVLEVPMPRLNMAHVSYRYNDEAWTQLSAGDQLPMVTWPAVNRHPVFFLPPKVGKLQIIFEIPVPGLFPSPVLLISDPVFRAAQTALNLQSGTALGLSFVTLLFCAGAGLILKRFAFVAVGIYAISIFLVTAGQGGIFGMYLGTTTAWFNDYVKYATGVLFSAIIPWTISVVTAQKHYSMVVARLANAWPVLSVLAMLVMPVLDPQTQWKLLAPFLVASLLFGGGLALASATRGQAHGFLALAAALLLCAGVFAPVAAYWGFLDGTFSFSVSAFCFLLSTTLLLLAVLLQYRHGNRVFARAQRAPGRDALTGLLNRDTFGRKLAKVALGVKPHGSQALFMYIAVSERDTLEERFGGEGFESGMVQIAAALSSSISVIDTVARISTNAFGVLAEMPQDAKLGSALAQKIIGRIMAVASHASPMAQTARIALAWVPQYGKALSNLEPLARQVLVKMEEGKTVGWATGQPVHREVAHMQGPIDAKSDAVVHQRSRSDKLHSLINAIEDTMHEEGFAAIKKRIDRSGRTSDHKPH